MRSSWESSNICQPSWGFSARLRGKLWLGCFRSFRRTRRNGGSGSPLVSNLGRSFRYTNLSSYLSMWYPFCLNSVRIRSIQSGSQPPGRWPTSSRSWVSRKDLWLDWYSQSRPLEHLPSIHSVKSTYTSMQIPDNVLEIDEQSWAVQRAFPAHSGGTGRWQGGECEVGAGLDREEAYRGGGEIE